jgi:dihydrofolate reductase
MAVQYYVAASVDGFIAAPGDDLAWLMQFGMEEFQAHYDRFISDVGALVTGSSTYEFIRREGGDWAYADTPTWVLTSRVLEPFEGADLRFAEADIVEVVGAARDAAGERNVWIVGGGDVAAQVADAGLLDELHLTLMPVVLGRGTALLPVGATLGPLQLLRSTTFDSGAVEHVYSLHASG